VTRYIARRLVASLITALLASLLVFLIVRQVPGDVVGQMLGQTSDPVAEQAMRRFFGIDEPLYWQYGKWIAGVLTGDLGTSFVRGSSVAGMVRDAFLVTLEIGLLTLLVATAIGVPLGVLAGRYEGRWPDRLVQSFSLIGLSAPVFWIGLMLLVGVSTSVGWSPPFSYAPPWASLRDNLEILLLPILSLGLLQSAAYAQFVRASVVSAYHQDYVRTAISKGLPMRIVFFKHILRNILVPLTTFIGLVLIQILGGVVVVESLFAIPGLGRLLLTAIETRDYPLLQGALLVVVVVAMVVNLAVDLLYRVIDPRVRMG
jgi:peptide/nickel transport system permease protein